MSEPVSHEPKWHWHAAPSEKDGTGRRLRALTTKPPGVMAGFVEDNWSQKCEKLQHGRDFLWTSKEPRIGQRIELNCTAPSDKFFRMSGMLTAVDNSPPPPGVLPPIMPHCHDKEDHTYDYHYEVGSSFLSKLFSSFSSPVAPRRRLATRTISLKPTV